jgi:hypothetical protein
MVSTGASACIKCPAGKYAAASASTICTECPAHTFSVVGSIILLNCTCTKGYTGPDGVECTACDAGGFKDTNCSAACTLCAQGKYSTVTATIFNDSCQDCPFYTYSVVGIGLLTNCTCNKGYTGPDGMECAACRAGTYKDVIGSALCSLCSGFMSPALPAPHRNWFWCC